MAVLGRIAGLPMARGSYHSSAVPVAAVGTALPHGYGRARPSVDADDLAAPSSAVPPPPPPAVQWQRAADAAAAATGFEYALPADKPPQPH